MSTPLMCAEHNTTCDRMSKIWHHFASLLEEAVLKGSYTGVEMLLEHELLLESRYAERHPSKYRQRCTQPIILAAEQNHFQMLKLFLKYHYIIPQPHVTNCDCDYCLNDKLGQARHRLDVLKALSNPLWIALTSDDPFLTSYKLHRLNQTFQHEDDSFELVYEQQAVENVRFCVSLLDEVRSEREGQLLMRCKTHQHDIDPCSDLSFVNVALDYSQKEVAAHAVVQHYLTSKVFDNIPGWRTSGLVYKIFFVIGTGIFFPVTTLLNILFPCWSNVGDVAMKPFVKFINGAASFILFLVLLSVMSTQEKAGLRLAGGFSPLEISVFVWLIGFCVGEFQQLYKRGFWDYLSSGWNWVDIAMDTLMMFAFLTWIVLYFYCTEDDHYYDTLIAVADGAFSVAIIFSFARVIYLCQITSYLGLLQLCLGKMVMVILQFAFICAIVLLSFTIAMVFLFRASARHDEITEIYHEEHRNNSGIYNALTENFNGFWATLFTMAWVSLSMKDTETVQDFADGSLIHLFANLLFIVYFAITMIVVLNMLIAMMNNSYQVIADNLSTEHKYSRTCLWMEYIGDEQQRPVPFNLIPSWKGTKKVFSYIWNTCCHSKCTDERYINPTIEREAKRRYKQLCDILMDRYMLKTHHFSIYDDAVEHLHCSKSDPFIQKILKVFQVWNIYQETGVFKDSILDVVGPSLPPAQLYIAEDSNDEMEPEWKDFLVL